MKKTFILFASKGYWIGVITNLHALKFYGHEEDIHVLAWDDVSDEDIEKVNREYPEVKVIKMDSFRPGIKFPDTKQKRGWECRWLKFLYALDLPYDVFWFLGGDTLLLNNVKQYFEIAKVFTIMSNNFCYYGYRKNVGKPLEQEMQNPFATPPFATSDKVLLEEIWKRGQDRNYLEKGRGDMKCIYNALQAQGKCNDVFLVPMNHWHGYDFNWTRIKRDGEGGYYHFDGSRINTVHGKLWSEGFCNRRSVTDIGRGNYKLFYDLYHKSYLG